MFGAIIKKGKKILKGKKGNPGNPGTSKRKQRRAVKAANKNTIPQNVMSEEVGGAVSTSGGVGIYGGLQKFATQVSAQKTEAMKGLVSNNPKLVDMLKNATGSTNIKDFAAYFAKVPPAQQQEMIVQSRTNTDIDEPQGTVDKIFDYASKATGIYRDASGMDDAAAAKQAKQKNITLVIVGVVVIATVAAIIFLLKTKKKVV